MTESEFEQLADAALASLESALERAADSGALDLDVQRKGAGLLEIEFENGSRIVINRHGAAREIWVAARSGGFHFGHDGTGWRATRDGSELFSAVSKLVSEQGETPVLLRPER